LVVGDVGYDVVNNEPIATELVAKLDPYTKRRELSFNDLFDVCDLVISTVTSVITAVRGILNPQFLRIK